MGLEIIVYKHENYITSNHSETVRKILALDMKVTYVSVARENIFTVYNLQIMLQTFLDF